MEVRHIDILGNPGTVSGAGEKSKRARKKFGRRKVKAKTDNKQTYQVCWKIYKRLVKKKFLTTHIFI